MENGWVREDLFNGARVEATYEWVMQRLGTRKPASKEVNQNNRVLQDGALEEGLTPARYHLNAQAPAGGQDEILKISAVDAFLNPALQGAIRTESLLFPLPVLQKC